MNVVNDPIEILQRNDPGVSDLTIRLYGNEPIMEAELVQALSQRLHY